MLRALQSGEVCRVGSEHVIHVDVRVLAATNKDLEREVAAGAFREDLFFRLNVFPIRSPALRERVEDIRPLADAFVAAFCKENGLRKQADRRHGLQGARSAELAGQRARAEERGRARGDPLRRRHHHRRSARGSAREPLRRRGRVADGDGAGDDLASEPLLEARRRESPASGVERLTLREFREQSERRYIVDTLRGLDWNISRTAIVLGVERTNLHKKIRAYGIKRGEA